MNLFALLPYFLPLLSTALGNCGDNSWIPSENQKCYRFVYPSANRDDADRLCASLYNKDGPNAEVLNIKSTREHEFVIKLFERLGIVDSVWVEAKLLNQTTLEDLGGGGDSVSFDSTRVCMELTPQDSKNVSGTGRWFWNNVPCTKQNLVVCQKSLPLSLEKLQDLVLNLQEMISEIKMNPVPTGFLYTEYPNQPGPHTLWPSVMWKEVTAEYSGLFFRAAGGDSLPFGEIQVGDSPRLRDVTFGTSNDGSQVGFKISVPPDGTESEWVTSGYYNLNPTITHAEFLKFRLSSGEVRPTNVAIRIWKRI